MVLLKVLLKLFIVFSVFLGEVLFKISEFLFMMIGSFILRARSR